MDTSLQDRAAFTTRSRPTSSRVAPTRGYRYLDQFDQDPLPRWTWNSLRCPRADDRPGSTGTTPWCCVTSGEGQKPVPWVCVPSWRSALSTGWCASMARWCRASSCAKARFGCARFRRYPVWSSGTRRPSWARPIGGAASNISPNRPAASISKKTCGPPEHLHSTWSQRGRPSSWWRSTRSPKSLPRRSWPRPRCLGAAA